MIPLPSTAPPEAVANGEVEAAFIRSLSPRYSRIAPDRLASEAFPTCFLPSAGPNLATLALLESSVPTLWDRVAVIQPCIRYWDLPNVGDGRHLSCFHMATFAALRTADRGMILADLLRVLTVELGLDIERLWATVYAAGQVAGQSFPCDHEAVATWRELGIQARRVVPVFGSEGFVANRQEAVGGYRTEIYFELRKRGTPCARGEGACLPGSCDCGRFVEVATAVSYAFAVDLDQSPAIRSIVAPPVHAAGFGVERLYQVLGGHDDIAEVAQISERSNAIVRRAPRKNRPAAHRAADHLLALAYLAEEGALTLPGRKQKGRRWIVNRYLRSLAEALAALGLAAADLSEQGLLEPFAPLRDKSARRAFGTWLGLRLGDHA